VRSTDRLLSVLRILGPGLIAGSADDDPSGIGTYAIAGASLGYATLWTAIFSIPMMIAVQFTAAKISMVTRRGLAETLQRHYPAWILYPALIGLVGANTVNAGADLGAIAAGVELLVPIPKGVVVPIVAVLLIALLVLGSYSVVEKTFKWLTLALLAYVGAAALAHPDWPAALAATVRPTVSLDGKYISTIVALFGTVISPYLFFWQATEEVEEIKHQSNRHTRLIRSINQRLHNRAIDVGAGMLFSNVITYFVILATAATLNANGQSDVNSAADAARALQPLAGNAASLLFAIGLIGCGVLAVPVLTGSAAYAVAGARKWRSGLDLSFGLVTFEPRQNRAEDLDFALGQMERAFLVGRSSCVLAIIRTSLAAIARSPRIAGDQHRRQRGCQVAKHAYRVHHDQEANHFAAGRHRIQLVRNGGRGRR
jgi:NRAMP (natural resistance-associated macrophage protein)-like metal ion transporter